MTGSAQPTELEAVAQPIMISSGILQDGEVILLAIKPSGWYILLASWPILLVAALAVVASSVADGFIGSDRSARVLFPACLLLAVACLTAAFIGWLGRMYVLTNRRILRIYSMRKLDVACWDLRSVNQVLLTASRAEKLLGIASLTLTLDHPDDKQPAWAHISRPLEVHKIVLEAVYRAKGM
ncbi:MAG: hypothetical protein LLG01_09710 [Planctomycetaceae bacterium]|nr:hypothetical protein [Planctomycetaceae bacterium]